jgi:UrcA family protein
MTMRKTILITAAFLAAFAAIPAAAQTFATRPVPNADLDLGTRAGRAMLDRRIAVAVESVCGSYASAASTETREIDRCRAAARNGVETQLAALQQRNSRLALSSR